MEEIWKDIKGYEGLYQVSNMGNVRSLMYNKHKILKPHKTENGYLQVFLYKDKKRSVFLLHRIVAKAFLPNNNNLPQLNHINEIKSDNRLENLEWCDNSYNNKYGSISKRRKEKLGKQVIQFSMDGDFIHKWDSLADIKKEIGIERSNIYNCCIGKYQKSGGYKWGYADDYEEIPFNVFKLKIYRKKVA